MGRFRRLLVRLTLALTALTSIATCFMLTAVAWVPPERAAREAARARWEARGFTSYRVALRVEALGKICYQQLEVNGEWVRRTLRNTCDSLWLDVMTIDQLFELSEEIQELPFSRCAPASRSCPCHRVFTERGVYYDEDLGYPTTLLARSEMQYNWTSADFWRSWLRDAELPACAPSRRRLTVQVLALTPLDARR